MQNALSLSMVKKHLDQKFDSWNSHILHNKYLDNPKKNHLKLMSFKAKCFCISFMLLHTSFLIPVCSMLYPWVASDLVHDFNIHILILKININLHRTIRKWPSEYQKTLLKKKSKILELYSVKSHFWYLKNDVTSDENEVSQPNSFDLF